MSKWSKTLLFDLSHLNPSQFKGITRFAAQTLGTLGLALSIVWITPPQLASAQPIGRGGDPIEDLIAQENSLSPKGALLKYTVNIRRQWRMRRDAIEAKRKAGTLSEKEDAEFKIRTAFIGGSATIAKLRSALGLTDIDIVYLLSDAGVGKTAVVRALARDNAEFEILELKLNDLLGGAAIRGFEEARISKVFKALTEAKEHDGTVRYVLFIDEAHRIVDNPRLMQELKTMTNGGQIKVIMATTKREYVQKIEKDEALVRRGATIEMNSLNKEEIKDRIRNMKPLYKIVYGYSVSDRAIEEAIELSEKFFARKPLASAAKELIEYTLSRFRDELKFGVHTLDAVKDRLASLKNYRRSILEDLAREAGKGEATDEFKISEFQTIIDDTEREIGIAEEEARGLEKSGGRPTLTNQLELLKDQRSDEEFKRDTAEVELEQIKHELEQLERDIVRAKGESAGASMLQALQEIARMRIERHAAASAEPRDQRKLDNLDSAIQGKVNALKKAHPDASSTIENHMRLSERKFALDIDYQTAVKALTRLEGSIARVIDATNAEMRRQTQDLQVTEVDLRNSASIQTGIPASVMGMSSLDRVKKLATFWVDNVFGQNEVWIALEKKLKSRDQNLDFRNKALVIWLDGPSGVGKTHIARMIARGYFGHSQAFLKFSMGNYQSSGDVWKAIGSSRGYVGSEEGGLITGAIRNSPFSVFLFDEFEKAHEDIRKALLDAFDDDGRLEDSEGRPVTLKHGITILTGNTLAEWARMRDRMKAEPMTLALWAKEAESKYGFTEGELHNIAMDPALNHEQKVADIDRLVQRKAMRMMGFSEEFLNRIDVFITTNPLSLEMAQQIAKKQMQSQRDKLKRDHRVTLKWTEAVEDAIAKIAFNKSDGGRQVIDTRQEWVTETMLSQLFEESKPKPRETIELEFHLDKDGKGGSFEVKLEGNSFRKYPVPFPQPRAMMSLKSFGRGTLGGPAERRVDDPRALEQLMKKIK